MNSATRQCSDPAEVRYQVDSNGRLVGFNAAWDSFASENDTPSLASTLVTGRLLRDFIGGAEVRHVHEVLLKRARASKRTITLPFRCDAPALRRFMEMDITCLANGNIEYRCRLLHTEPRLPVPVVTNRLDGPLLRMCSWCNRVDAGGQHWLEIEDAVTRLGLLGDMPHAAISHTICNDCLIALEGEDEPGG